MDPLSGEITQMLNAWGQGDGSALERLVPLVEAELRNVARGYINREGPGQTLQPTALINEAYLRLINWNNVEWQNRAHFFAVAAKLMRRVLVNQAVARRTDKRGALPVIVSLLEAGGAPDRSASITNLDEVLVALAKIDDRKSRLVELRFFGGLTVEETAEVLGVSVRTVHREWDLTRAWLFRELGRADVKRV